MAELVADKDSDFSEEEELQEEEVDPRVKGELDCLNSASDEINVLETELERARTKFRSLLNESSQRLNALYKKLGKCVVKARAYYGLQRDSQRAQGEAQRAAINFQRANSIYQAAKETVSLAEEKVITYDGEKRQFDSAWQEMLNHATIKFMESEKERAKSELEHSAKAGEYASIQQKVRHLEKDMPKSIPKARPYFELKDKLEHHLQVERLNVEDLQRGLVCAKQKYKMALQRLEAISEEIHLRRRHVARLKLPPRTPGVGAESPGDQADILPINLDLISDAASFASFDDDDETSSMHEGSLKSWSPESAPDSGFQSLSRSPLTYGGNDAATGDPAGGLRMQGSKSSRTSSCTSLDRETGDSDKHNRRQIPGQDQARRDSPVRTEQSPDVVKVSVRTTIMTGSQTVVTNREVQVPIASANGKTIPQSTVQTVTTVSTQRSLPKTSTKNKVVTSSSTSRTLSSDDRSSAKQPHSSRSSGRPATRESEQRPRSKSRDQRKMQTQMAFPMLQGLSEIHLRMSPKIQRVTRNNPTAPQPHPQPQQQQQQQQQQQCDAQRSLYSGQPVQQPNFQRGHSQPVIRNPNPVFSQYQHPVAPSGMGGALPTRHPAPQHALPQAIVRPIMKTVPLATPPSASSSSSSSSSQASPTVTTAPQNTPKGNPSPAVNSQMDRTTPQSTLLQDKTAGDPMVHADKIAAAQNRSSIDNVSASDQPSDTSPLANTVPRQSEDIPSTTQTTTLTVKEGGEIFV